MRSENTFLRIAVVLLVMPLAEVFAQTAVPRFSHQIHLKQDGVICVTCHSSAEKSAAVTDVNLPAETVCQSCHDGNQRPAVDTAFLRDRKPEERTFRFNHQFHLQMGNPAPVIAAAIDGKKYLGKVEGDMRRLLDTTNSCEACHRGLRETDVAAKVNMPQMSDCLVCHNQIRNPFSCEKCHVQGVNLMPANHTRNFVDEHSTGRLGLDKTTCLPCHGANFRCMGCH